MIRLGRRTSNIIPGKNPLISLKITTGLLFYFCFVPRPDNANAMIIILKISIYYQKIINKKKEIIGILCCNVITVLFRRNSRSVGR